ncbi:MAG TPA: glycosyl transferase, partial [Acidimicrobiia bacterium]|nr:glycosyl transferase [Acidimicrobiia bacterium]
LDVRNRLRQLAIPVLAFAVTLAPWVGYNLTRFDRPVVISTGFELTLNISSCDDTYYGPFTGYLSIECARRTALRARAEGLDQSEEATRHRRKALDYISEHTTRAPVVVAARWGRVMGVYRIDQTVDLGRVEGREPWVSRLALYTLWPVMILAAIGAVVLRRRRTTVYPLVALVAVALVTVALSYGAQRFRAVAEPALVVLAAVAIDRGLNRLQPRT